MSQISLHRDVMIHSACSAAILTQPIARANAVRLGISLYGLWPSQEIKSLAPQSLNLKPALKWKTQVIQTKTVSQGSTIGYGCTYKAPHKLKIAVLPVGYWEGYDRLLSNKAEVLINEKRCPVRGRICMNLTMVEIPLNSSIQSGDEVILLGTQKNDAITAEELADHAQTIHYEVVTRINSLIPRFVV